MASEAKKRVLILSGGGGGGSSVWGGITGTLADQTDLQAALDTKAAVGAAPVAHATSHQNGGSDEINVAGLSGLLADNQNPTTHAASHTNGTDDIQNATAAQKGLATAAQITKLDGIEALADVTDAANVTAAGAAMLGTANAWADGVKQTFNPDATNAGLNVGSIAGDPSSLANGDMWYDSTANELSARINGATVALGAGGGATETVISPTQLAADTDNWNPTGLSTATVIRADTDASLRYLSSITAPAGTQRLRLENISANTLILKDQSAALGTAANRINCGGYDLPLFPGDALDIRYDATSARWRVVDPQAHVIPPRRFGWYGVRPAFATTSADAGVFNAVSTVSGTGAANNIGTNDSDNVTPFLNLTTGTTTTGRAHFGSNSPNNILVGNNWYWRWASRIRLVDLSDATDTYTYRNGLIDSSSGESTDGVFFRYTDSVNSGNFELVLRSNSSETAVNCSAGPAANTWCDISITITPTRVEAYKDGVLIGSTTTMTNLPSGASRLTGVGAFILKSAGTTSRIAGLQSFELVGYKGVP